MALNVTIANLREDYQHSALLESDVSPNPFKQFQTWFDQAIAAALPEPNAMTLATATTDGIPSARIVLLKGFDEQGFVFFSNYNSHKGQEIEANPHVALVFLWKELERQVRIQGRIERTTTAESDEYFDSRPEGSRLGAWVSEQSRVIPNRNVLDQQLEVLKQQYRDQAIPRPPHWGGFRVKPQAIEFWQGRSSRLHDRLLYQLDTSGNWRIDRLAP